MNGAVVLTQAELLDLIMMRNAQKGYFKTRELGLLIQARDVEKRVDAMLERLIDQQTNLAMEMFEESSREVVP